MAGLLSALGRTAELRQTPRAESHAVTWVHA